MQRRHFRFTNLLIQHANHTWTDVPEALLQSEKPLFEQMQKKKQKTAECTFWPRLSQLCHMFA